MAKNIRWQIPFVSIGGTHYRIDIYDEGTFTPVTLTGGTNPFTTSEDDSDDYFAPIRVQTGTIEVCTLMPDGNYITLDDLLPANNIARPVKLWRIIGGGAAGVLEWQGFLSCEAYDQDYTGIPQIIQLPVIGVLEAMDSVEVELDESKAFLRILGHVCNAMKAIETESGMGDLWGSMYLSQYCEYEMVAKYFYNNVYFSTQEQVSGDNIVVEIHSISCKDILSQVAQFFGGCWRENGRDLYFEVIGKSSAFTYNTFANIYNEMINGYMPSGWGVVSMTESQANQLQWRGTGHQRTVAQGAQRVKVIAGLRNFECKMTLQECPIGSLVENPEARQATWGEVHVNTNETFYSLAEHKHATMQVKAEQVDGQTKISLSKLYNISGIGYGSTWFWAENEYLRDYANLKVAGATGQVNSTATSFMAWMRVKADADSEPELKSGLMVCGLPHGYLSFMYQSSFSWIWTAWYTLTENDYVFKQKNALVFAAINGHFTLDVEWDAFTANGKTFNTYEKKRSGYAEGRRGVEMAIKWGNLWLKNDRTGWQSSFVTFSALDGQKYEDEGMNGKVHLEFPVNGHNAGFITLYIFPKVYGNFESDGIQDVHNLFITKMDLSYIAPDEELRTDRSENIYAQNLRTAFRDEIETNVELATDANNTKFATMLWESDGTTPVKLLLLGSGSLIRPEVDLLNRLATYYGAARQRLSLIVAHPTAAPLPILRLNGISPDTRKYLPLAESRDWQEETCTLTCFETPNNE